MVVKSVVLPGLFYIVIFFIAGIFSPFGLITTESLVVNIFYVFILTVLGVRFVKILKKNEVQFVEARNGIIPRIISLTICGYFTWKLLLVWPYFGLNILVREYISENKPHILNNIDLYLFQILYSFLKIYVYTWLLFSRRINVTVVLFIYSFVLAFITMLSRSELLNIALLGLPFLTFKGFKSKLKSLVYGIIIMLSVGLLRPNLTFYLGLKYAVLNVIMYNIYPLYLYDIFLRDWSILKMNIAGILGYPFVKIASLFGYEDLPAPDYYVHFENLGNLGDISASANVLYNTPAHFRGVFGFGALLFILLVLLFVMIKTYRYKLYSFSTAIFLMLFLYSPKRHLLVVPEFWIMLLVSFFCIPLFYAPKYYNSNVQ